MEKLKYIVAAVLVFMVSFVGGCCGADAKTAEADEQGLRDRFVVIEEEELGLTDLYANSILKDKETGVLYLLIEGYQRAGITVLVDAEGKPLVDKGE